APRHEHLRPRGGAQLRTQDRRRHARGSARASGPHQGVSRSGGLMLLETKGLHASYGATRVLHGIDFALEEGSITTLLGANGAGKTTTLRALCGMVKAAGEVSFAGKRIDGRATEDIVRLGVAHVPDGRGTFAH